MQAQGQMLTILFVSFRDLCHRDKYGFQIEYIYIYIVFFQGNAAIFCSVLESDELIDAI